MNEQVSALAGFLLARFVEEEAAIAAADVATHRRKSDARSYADCQARRAIVTVCSEEGAPVHCRVILTLMALPYADHSEYPEYREVLGAGMDDVRQSA